jgi:hypothetical protein
MRWSGWLTPWRMLWMFLVMRNTPGRGLGTTRCYSKVENGVWASVLTIPRQVDTHETRKSHQCVTHECDSASLGSRAEKSNLCLVAPELLGVRQHGFPCSMATRILVVLDSG